MKYFAFLLLLLCGSYANSLSPEKADRVYLNARVWTGEERLTPAEAIAVRGDHILAVGSNAEVRKLIGAETAIVDLKGQFVVPGFNDAHWHFISSE